jgi:hypothetical protein
VTKYTTSFKKIWRFCREGVSPSSFQSRISSNEMKKKIFKRNWWDSLMETLHSITNKFNVKRPMLLAKQVIKLTFSGYNALRFKNKILCILVETVVALRFMHKNSAYLLIWEYTTSVKCIPFLENNHIFQLIKLKNRSKTYRSFIVCSSGGHDFEVGLMAGAFRKSGIFWKLFWMKKRKIL